MPLRRRRPKGRRPGAFSLALALAASASFAGTARAQTPERRASSPITRDAKSGARPAGTRAPELSRAPAGALPDSGARSPIGEAPEVSAAPPEGVTASRAPVPEPSAAPSARGPAPRSIAGPPGASAQERSAAPPAPVRDAAGGARPATPITFSVAVGLADEHPLPRGLAAALGEARAFGGAVSRLPHNPQLLVQPGQRLAPDGAREPELLLELVQPLSLSGHGNARRESVRREDEALAAERAAALVAQRLQVAESWIAAWAAERALEEAERQREVAERLASLVTRAAGLGAATSADVAEADAFAAEARLSRIDADGEVFHRGVELARTAGRRAVAPLRAAGALPAPPVPGAERLTALLARATTLPEVERRALAARAARARLAEERAARGLSGAFGAVVERDAPGGLVVSATARISPPIFDRGERERSALAASARRHEAEAEAARVDAEAALVEAAHEVEHTDQILGEARERLLPAARRAAELRRRAFEGGHATLPEVLQAERAALAAAGRARRAEAAHAWARVKLWTLAAPLARAEARR